MSCKDCETAKDEGLVAYYRFGKTNIGMIGCSKHLRKIMSILNGYQSRCATDMGEEKKITYLKHP